MWLAWFCTNPQASSSGLRKSGVGYTPVIPALGEVVQGHSWLHSVFEASLGYRKSCLSERRCSEAFRPALVSGRASEEQGWPAKARVHLSQPPSLRTASARHCPLLLLMWVSGLELDPCTFRTTTFLTESPAPNCAFVPESHLVSHL